MLGNRIQDTFGQIAEWQAAASDEQGSLAVADGDPVSSVTEDKQPLVADAAVATKKRERALLLQTLGLESSVLIPVLGRSTLESFFKRLVELLAINFAANSGKLFDRTSDVLFVFLVFVILTLANFSVKYKLEEWNRRLARQRRIFDQVSRPMLEKDASERMGLPGNMDTDNLCARALLEAKVLDGDTVGISFAELLFSFVDYCLYVADIYVAFVLVRIIINRVEGSFEIPWNRLLQRMAKPFIAAAILFASIQISGYRQAKLMELVE